LIFVVQIVPWSWVIWQYWFKCTLHTVKWDGKIIMNCA
jgi:hypothetical protein